VQLLLEHGAEVNAEGDSLGNALQAAIVNGYNKVVQTLLDHGADIKTLRGLYGNALHAAIAWGKFDLVEMLLKHGADVIANGAKYGPTALQTAKKSPHCLHRDRMRDLLKEHGAKG
jgi:ankyrin repeat protein